jgi:3-methyl-2-oxobutanoate hydroxymethyltransferase
MGDRKRLTLHALRDCHARGEKLAALTCYDASFARLLDSEGVDILLVGDSLGMVVEGNATTLAVSMDALVHHTAAVARGNSTAWIIADMPFGSYHESETQALHNAVRLLQAGAHMVKVEGGAWVAPTIRFLVERGIAVCGHVGFTPQAVHALGGYRIQGRSTDAAAQLMADANSVTQAGAQLLVLELVPSAVAADLTARIGIPVIGIGAGSACSGQVLVLYDMLGLTHGTVPRFVRNFLADADSIAEAVRHYVADVKAGRFPDDQLHGY